ncbi:MAG: Nif3-like dinuclear metal center hexameric protein [Planctomycetota bacterium]
MPSTLGHALRALEDLAPLRLAAQWDNVGLLVEPPAAAGRAGHRRPLTGVLLAIDATDNVIVEAVRRRCQLVVAYHPPIFSGLKALRASAPRTRGLLRAVQNDIAIYSPHTALDAAAGGLNDWLAAPFGRVGAEPLEPIPGEPPGVGQGRLLTLPKAKTLAAIVTLLKQHLGVARLRVARSLLEPGAKVRTVALAAGAGGALLRDADLFFTGEMRHHDVLAAIEAGRHVVLAEHSLTERGYLPILARQLRRALGAGVRIHVSRADREPIQAG